MKRFIFALAGLTAVAAAAIAATPRLDNSIPQMNSVLADLLRPYQNNLTRASLRFLAMTTDDTKLLTAHLDGNYSRSGSVQTLDLQLKNAAFENRLGNPILNLSAEATFNFTRAFSHEQINAAVDSGEKMAEAYVLDRLKKYGAAAQVKATMLNRVKDAGGNYTSFRAMVTMSIDMTKLAPDMKKEDVLPLRGTMTFIVVLNRGITMESSMLLNPAYQNYPMIKQNLEKLLDRDVDMSKRVTTRFEKLNDFAGKLVEMRP